MPAAPMAIMLPAGWFQAGRLLELEGTPQDDKKRLVKLLTLIERGADFDRCAVEVL